MVADEAPRDWYDDDETMYEALSDCERGAARARCCYEAKNFWAGYMIADMGQGTSDSDDVPLMTYRAYPLDSLVQVIMESPQFATILADARQAWEDFRVKAKALGQDIPEGRLILVNDYD